MFKTVVLGAQAFTEARTRIDDAIKDYNAALGDLNLGIGLKTKEKTEEVLATVKETKTIIFGIFNTLLVD
jgi:hypothetical protein